MTKRCAIYARVSTPDQRVDNQLFDLRQFAAQRGYEVACEYTDVGISGTKARRPGLDALLCAARKRKFRVLIVSAFDRLARSTKHFLSVIDELDSLGLSSHRRGKTSQRTERWDDCLSHSSPPSLN